MHTYENDIERTLLVSAISFCFIKVSRLIFFAFFPFLIEAALEVNKMVGREKHMKAQRISMMMKN